MPPWVRCVCVCVCVCGWVGGWVGINQFFFSSFIYFSHNVTAVAILRGWCAFYSANIVQGSSPGYASCVLGVCIYIIMEMIKLLKLCTVCCVLSLKHAIHLLSSETVSRQVSCTLKSQTIRSRLLLFYTSSPWHRVGQSQQPACPSLSRPSSDARREDSQFEDL